MSIKPLCLAPQERVSLRECKLATGLHRARDVQSTGTTNFAAHFSLIVKDWTSNLGQKRRVLPGDFFDNFRGSKKFVHGGLGSLITNLTSILMYKASVQDIPRKCQLFENYLFFDKMVRNREKTTK